MRLMFKLVVSSLLGLVLLFVLAFAVLFTAAIAGEVTGHGPAGPATPPPTSQDQGPTTVTESYQLAGARYVCGKVTRGWSCRHYIPAKMTPRKYHPAHTTKKGKHLAGYWSKAKFTAGHWSKWTFRKKLPHAVAVTVN